MRNTSYYEDQQWEDFRIILHDSHIDLKELAMKIIDLKDGA